MRRSAVTSRFALLSALAVTVTALVVHLVVRDSLQARTAESGTVTARVVAGLVSGQLGGGADWQGLAEAGPLLDRALAVQQRVAAVEVHDASGRLAFRSGQPVDGTAAQVRTALTGRTVRRDLPGDVAEVTVPVRTAQGRLSGAVTVRLDVGPERREAHRDERLLLAALLGCLLLLWTLMLWLAASVNRGVRRRAQAHQHLAATDVLTGLPNRRQLVSELDEALSAAGAALLLLDVDRFKQVNDTLGHAVGDQLLRVVGRRLVGALPDGRVARLGGDEFAVLLAGDLTAEQALARGRQARAVMAEPVSLDGVVLDVELSVGVALAPLHAATASDLLRCADVAMYASKQTGQGARLYEPALDAHEPDRLLLLADLRRALEGGGLSLVYQPVFDLLRDGRCLAVEALVRWDHPDRGAVPPEELVAMCERSGQVRALTRFVLDEALRAWRAWTAAGADLHLAVNLSARNLQEDDLPEAVEALLERYGVPAERLILEVTESAFVSEPERASAVVGRLAALGLNISVDDFGTGWSSMSRLLELPLRALKVDRSFVAELPDRPGAAVVAATVGVGHDLGLFVVGEGVETLAQLTRLRELRCDMAQGHLLGRPVPSQEVPRVARLVLGPDGPQPGAGVPAARPAV